MRDSAVVDNFGTTYDKIVSEGYWTADGFALTADFYFINVTLGMAMPAQVSAIVNLIFVILVLGLVVTIAGESVRMLKKPKPVDQQIRSLMNMVISLVVGLALIGAAYTIII